MRKAKLAKLIRDRIQILEPLTRGRAPLSAAARERTACLISLIPFPDTVVIGPGPPARTTGRRTGDEDDQAVPARARMERTCPPWRRGDFRRARAAPRGPGATEATAREDARRAAAKLRAPYDDFNGEAFLVVPG